MTNSKKKHRPSVDAYVTVPEAIEQLGVKKTTMYHWIRTDQLPSDYIGDTMIILRKDLMSLRNIR